MHIKCNVNMLYEYFQCLFAVAGLLAKAIFVKFMAIDGNFVCLF